MSLLCRLGFHTRWQEPWDETAKAPSSESDRCQQVTITLNCQHCDATKQAKRWRAHRWKEIVHATMADIADVSPKLVPLSGLFEGASFQKCEVCGKEKTILKARR